jgi:hypothetical protein
MQVTPDHRWSPKAPMPPPALTSAAAVNNKIYAIGGFGEPSAYLATVEEYHAPSALYLHQKN